MYQFEIGSWAERKYKRFRRKPNDAYKWLVRVASKKSCLVLPLAKHGVKPIDETVWMRGAV